MKLILLSLYLLASVRGAPPGQPDNLLDSVDNQGSVQQLSSEYFSLANPSDSEALYETPSSEKALTDHSSSDHESSEHATGEHASGEHTSGEHASGEHASGEHTSGEQTSEHISGEHITSEHTSGEHTSGEHTSSEHTSGEQSSSESSEQPSESSSVEQVSGEKTEELDEQTSADGSSSTPFPSTSSSIAINCHTCTYMNDDGKCLRGEGVCTTQNSQQCMLKKIFEGGKLQFMVQGCENMCPSMNLFSHGTRMQIICCRNEPLCNKT
ncbi:acrosomal protein SP-10 [Acomys russatus]|uniref:acrosomal protein SP-10 n=1 Tax=Acomys russatus TaxID=60746 RepID=UPI0021E28282|nr:acrosomal protein SP-10 [Acomys russatus]